MASLTRTRCSVHLSLLSRHNRISSTRKLVRLQIKETRCFASTAASYHTTGRGVTGVGSRRMTTPHHLTLTLLTPPHLTPSHRQLSSLSSIFNKMLTVNAATPVPEDSSATPPDPDILGATSQSVGESFSSLQAAAEDTLVPPLNESTIDATSQSAAESFSSADLTLDTATSHSSGESFSSLNTAADLTLDTTTLDATTQSSGESFSSLHAAADLTLDTATLDATSHSSGESFSSLFAAAEDTIVSPPDISTPTDTTSQFVGESFSSLQAAVESIEYIPPPPAPPEVLAPALNALGEPTFQSLGLAGWTPVGMVQSVLENIHVTFDIPWWGTIAIVTVMIRTLIFPLVLLSQRNAAKMHNNLPQLQILQMKMTEARNSGDQMNAARYGQEMVQFMKEKDMSPLKNIIVPLAQAPIFISMFMALRKLANLPVESFKDGGMLWFTDLTLCDPFYALPIITSLTMMATIELGADGAKLSSQNMQMMKYVLRALPLFVFPFTLSFPTAVLCYWVSTNAFSLVQVGFLKIPAVREYFNIERSVSHKPETLPPKKGVIEGFQESWSNMKITKELNERANFDEMRFKKAGAGPVVRTYKHDPTKVINVQAKVRDGK